jgi:two-component system, sensor histidine kinase and response regulator
MRKLLADVPKIAASAALLLAATAMLGAGWPRAAAPTFGWLAALLGVVVVPTAALTHLVVSLRRRDRRIGELECEKLRGSAIFDASLDGLIVMDHHGSIIDFNPAAEEIFGYRRDAVLGARMADLIVPERLRAAHAAGLARYVATGVARVQNRRLEMPAIRADGTEFPVELSIVRLPASEPPVFIGYVRDITERVAARETVEKAREAAEAESRAKTDFIAVMSHEIRTPMNVVLGMAEILDDSPLSEGQAELVGAIRSNSEALLGLLNDFLDSYKLGSGDVEIERIPFDLRDVVEGTAEILGPRAAARGIEFVTIIDPAIPHQLLGDPNRLRQILLNLVGNALKFTNTGEIVLRARRRSPSASDPTRSQIRITVSDTGLGIPAADLERIFEPFVQLGSPTMRRGGGTGLGLSISRSLIELLGGRISVASREGTGTTFTVQIPYEVPPEQLDPPTPLFSGSSVVVVESSRAGRHAITTSLAGAGLRVVVATGIEDAERVVRTLDGDYAMIVNETLADGRGLDLLRRLDRRPGRGTPSVLLVCAASSEQVGRVGSLGIVGYVYKPLRQRRLLDAVMNLLRVRPEQPADEIHELRALRPELARSVRLPETGAPRRILLAEDNDENAQLMVRTLESAGYQVDRAPNGTVAVRHAQDFVYDLILMDVEMPVQDGLQATREIRRTELAMQRPQVPILAVTAHAAEGFRTKCLACGMNDYATKPIKRDQLLRLVDRWVDRRPRVLVADGCEEMRLLLCRSLEGAELRPLSARDGAEAIDMVGRHRVEVVLLDMEMLGLDGLEVVRSIRATPGGDGVTIIALTGRDGAGVRQRCLENGCSEYLPKPFTLGEMLAAVWAHLPNGRPRPRPEPVALQNAEPLTGGEPAKRNAGTDAAASPTLPIAPAAEPEVATTPPFGWKPLVLFVEPDAEIRDLIPEYLEMRRADERLIGELAAAADFRRIQSVAHMMKGTGESFGFPVLTELARHLEGAARLHDAAAVASWHIRLQEVLTAIDQLFARVADSPLREENAG